MWKETPTAPYSLKTFFSCWVLLGFPPSGSSGAFTVDEELADTSFKFCRSWTQKSRSQLDTGGWIENMSVRWQTSHNEKIIQTGDTNGNKEADETCDDFQFANKILTFFTLIFYEHTSTYKTDKLQDKGLTYGSTDATVFLIETQKAKKLNHRYL